MRERSAALANRAVALLVLVIAVWFLAKFVIGFITGVATIIAVIVAIGAVIWSLNRL